MIKKFILLNLMLVSHCVQAGDVHVHENVPAPINHSLERLNKSGQSLPIKYLILHYTAESLERTLEIFTGDKVLVASHYTISEDGTIFDHVPEERAARHAGISYWRGKTELNLYSIGIEHVNLGYILNGIEKQWCPFEPKQIDSSIALCKEIIERHSIKPENVLGHSDIAPGRKFDPGPLFPWYKLYKNGIGAWPDLEDDKIHECLKIALKHETLNHWMIKHLNIWGYKRPDESACAKDIIGAFQMHFRPINISGNADIESALILDSLIYKYMGECKCG